MNGRDLTLGTLAGLAMAGMVAQRRRGSRELTALTAPQGLSPAQPWKGLVGAAKGGPSRESWKQAMDRLPFDLSIEVVGQDDADAWLAAVKRPRPGMVKVCVQSVDIETYNSRIVFSSRTAGNTTFTPFNIVHRLYDMTFTSIPETSAPSFDANGKLRGSQKLALGNVIGGRELTQNRSVTSVLEEWAQEDCQSMAPANLDVCKRSIFDRWEAIKRAYDSRPERIHRPGEPYDFTSQKYRIKEFYGRPLSGWEGDPKNWDDDVRGVAYSLFCPTAAGRLLVFADFSQAMADCYATHMLSGRNPLLTLTERDLAYFSVDDQIERWLATASAKKSTDLQIARYRSTLEQRAVPVLKALRKVDGALPALVQDWAGFRERRPKLIEAATDVLSLQRVVVM